MTENEKETQEEITKRVRASLGKADEIVRGYKRNNEYLVITSIVSSAFATLVAGMTAAVGPMSEIGASGWRTACIIAAILAFVSTVSAGISHQFKSEERVADGKQCVGRLKNLEVEITTKSKKWDEIEREYAEIVKAYPELV
jgi:hypothetical protein